MKGYNTSLYLQDENEWIMFKNACKSLDEKPNTILRNFISQYTMEIFGEKRSLEKKIASSMFEAKKIANGKIKAKKAIDLLDEL